MSIRKDLNQVVRAGNNGERLLEDATVYVTKREEARTVPTDNLLMASSLVIIEDGSIYMLDNDGDRGGVWRSIADGSVLS